METMLPFIIAIPLGTAFLLPLLEKSSVGAKLSEILAVVVSSALLIISVTCLGNPDIQYWMGGWSLGSGALGINIILDRLSCFMLVVVNSIAFVSTIYSLNYMKRYTSQPIFYCLFFLMVTGMNGVILAGDIFNLYVFLEIAAIASYALVAFGCEKEELEAAFKYLVLGTVGSAFILLGIAILYNQTGHLNMSEIAKILPQNNVVLLAAAFFLMGFGLKAAMVPFHAWLPDAHPSAPAPISAMLSGVLIKALGVYALIRIFFGVLAINSHITYILMFIGCLSMIIGVLLAIGQSDFKRLLAYSSISQMGYIVLAFGLAGELLLLKKTSWANLALLGGLFHLMNHATSKSLLFLCSGATEYATGTRQLNDLGGIKHRMPLTGGCLRIASLSMSGIPPFSGFWSKLIIVIAVMQAGHYWIGAIAILVSFMTLLTYLKVQRSVLDGDCSPLVANAREVPMAMCLAMVLLAIICVCAGLLLPWYKDVLFDPAGSVLVDNFEKTINLLQMASGG